MIGLLNYNAFLYTRREKLGLTRKEFAKGIGISHLHYYLIETGYVKPSKKVEVKISNYLEEDYSNCMIGENSYSVELPEKEKSKIVKVIYNILGSLWLKIVFITLMVLGLANIITSTIIDANVRNDKTKYYDEKIVLLQDYIAKNGTMTFDLLNQTERYEIFVKDFNDGITKYIAVKCSDDPNKIDKIEFNTTYWTSEYRFTSIYSKGKFKFIYIDYQTSEEYVDEINMSSSIYVKDLIKVNTNSIPEDVLANEDIIGMIISFEDELTDLIKSKANIDIDFYTDIYVTYAKASKKMNTYSVLYFTFYITGWILFLASGFMLIYSYLFGTKNSIERIYQTENLALKKPKNIPLKTDIRITPFIPETVLEILGIILIFIASFRFYLWLATALGVSNISIFTVKEYDNEFRFVFFIGMFLLYFIDFEAFLGDKRTVRNIFMYLFMFIGVYVIEMLLISVVYDTGSIVYQQLIKQVTLPNMFFSISMYFLIIYFLYFTPKIINTKKRLLIFRSLSIIPVILLLTFFIIFKLANTTFGWNLPDYVLYMFDSERIIFSILCITYLFSLFFIKTYFKKKYGTRRADMFFNGNKFIFIKNILICSIVLLVAIFDYLVKDDPLFITMGFGKTYGIITLIPFLLFYHPHKGQRNAIIDIITTILYMGAVISFVIIFLLTGFGEVIL